MTDLAVVAQDPRFGGGARAQTEAFWRAAVELGRAPSLFYVAQPGVRGDPYGTALPPGTSARALARGVDSLNQLVGGIRLAGELPPESALWVCAAAASHGYAAARAGRPYGCWIGTSLEAEWRASRPGLPRARGLARRLNAPVLLRLERRVLEEAAIVCATSPASCAALEATGAVPRGRIRILPIPVDPEVFSPEPDAEWRAHLAQPTLVFVGRGDDPRKNVSLLLDAFTRIRERLPHVRLRLVGTPPPGSLPSGVEVRDAVDSVPDELADAALFVLPSLQEGFGIVAAEALACGVPVLTTPCGGPEELVASSRGGLILGGWDAGELADAAVDLIDDPDALFAMRESGRDYVTREHSPARLRELLAAAFAELDARS